VEALVKDAVRLGLLNGEDRPEDIAQFTNIMHRFVELLPQQPEIRQTGEAVVRIIIEETNFENCSLIMWDHERGKLSLLAAFGLKDLLKDRAVKQYNRSLTFSPGEGIAGRVFTTQEPIFIEHSEQMRIPPLRGAVVQPACLACLPLDGIGVLNISSHLPRQFSPTLKRKWGLLSKFIACLISQTYRTEQQPLPLPNEFFSPEMGLREAPPAPFERGPLDLEIIDHIPLGICVLDSRGKLLQINDGIRKLQGEQVEQVIGRTPSVFFHNAAAYDDIINRLGSSRQVEATDIVLINANGELYLADIYAARLECASGTVSGYLLIIVDMTRKKSLTEKMIRTEKLAALGTMAGGVAHDFNNLLMAIMGNVQMIQHCGVDEEVRRRLKNIERAIQDGSNTVRRLQKFTEREKQPQSVSSVDVAEAIKDVVELTRPRWKDEMEKRSLSLELKMNLQPGCFADANPSDFREVLMNLIFNAIEAMPEGGVLTLSNRNAGEWVLVDVADSGVGISKAVVGKIFDPFYTTKGIGNSGLGLTVSWGLMNRIGGDIQVKSQVGKGATFSVKLPRSKVECTPDHFFDLKQDSPTYRVLVVDDDVQVLEIVTDMLRLKGHEVIAESDSRVALRLIQDEEFDLVLTDLGMPVVNGWQIAEQVKAMRPNTPIILLTGWGAQYEEEDLAAHGVNLILSKPLSLESLLASVEQTLLAASGVAQQQG